LHVLHKPALQPIITNIDILHRKRKNEIIIASASGGFVPDPHRVSAPKPYWGHPSPRPPINFVHPGKNHAGAHGSFKIIKHGTI